MKPMTRVTIKWHLGIPDGERRYEEEIPYNDDLNQLALLTKEILPKTELFKSYDSTTFQVAIKYGQLEVYNTNHDEFETQVATVEITHFLLIGTNRFKLIQEN